MDRRKFVTAAIVGVGASGVVRANDFIFPRKSEVKPLLEGLTDEEMAALIGQFPQGKGSLQTIFRWGIEIRELRPGFRQFETISLWTIEGTVIHAVAKTPELQFNFDADTTQTGWSIKKQADLDVKSLDLIRLFHSTPEYKRTEYRRIETASGAGWFGL